MLQHYLDHHSVQVTKGDNPLVYAALYGDVLRVQMLLDKGLDVNIEARVPGTPLIPACTMPPLIAATHNRTL
jgi:ankyrin repeat protein